MLKSEIKRIYESHNNTRGEQRSDAKKSNVLDRKNVILKEIINQLKIEKLNLQKKLFEYKQKSDDIERKYNALTIEYTNFGNFTRKKMYN